MKNTTILFWNMKGKSLEPMVADLAMEQTADVICLAENGAKQSSLEVALNASTGKRYTTVLTRTPKLTVLTCDPSLNLRELYGDVSGRLSIRQLMIAGKEFLLAIGHFHSKLSRKPSEQNSAMQSFADEIRSLEQKRKNSRTI